MTSLMSRVSLLMARLPNPVLWWWWLVLLQRHFLKVSIILINPSICFSADVPAEKEAPSPLSLGHLGSADGGTYAEGWF